MLTYKICKTLTGKIVSDVIQYDAGDTRIKAIIGLWLENVATIDRRLRLLSKMQTMRKAKVSSMPFVRFHSEFVGQLLMSQDKALAKAKATTQWVVSGDFALTDFDDHDYPNVLLTCVNPLLKDDLVSKVYQQSPAFDKEISQYKWLHETVDAEDQLVFAPHAIDSPFQVGVTFTNFEEASY